jgi:hypothetical protein
MLKHSLHRLPLLRLVVGLLAGSAAASLSGCVVAAVAAAAAGTVAYIKGELNATLEADVPAVAQATEAAIKNMKFFAISSKHDTVSGAFVARNAKDERITITLTKTGSGLTKTEIRVGILGDEELSRAILEEIRQGL